MSEEPETAAGRALYEARFEFERNHHRKADRHGLHIWGCYRQRDVAELLTVDRIAAIEAEARSAAVAPLEKALDRALRDFVEVESYVGKANVFLQESERRIAAALAAAPAVREPEDGLDLVDPSDTLPASQQ